MGATNSYNEISAVKPAHDFKFRGKWLVRYEPGEFTYPEILTLLPPLQTRLEPQGLNCEFLNISFSRTVPRSRFFQVGDHLFVKHNGSDMQLSETDPGAFAVQTRLEPLARPIQRGRPAVPAPAERSALEDHGPARSPAFPGRGPAGQRLFGLSPAPGPAGRRPPGAAAADMIGFTLFEDLLPAMRDYLAGLRRQYQGVIAAGGPLLTLAPLAALYHLPQIELAVRGEAELVLPGVLKALNQGDLEALFSHPGVFWQQPGLVVLSAFDRVNRPETFRRLAVDLSFLQPGHMAHGLEMNFSRGCKRGCVFCCRVQGAKFRKLPLEKAEEILAQYERKLEEFALAGGESRAMNINDDDILQDPAYAAAVFALLKKHGWRIHGVQTSPASLLPGGEAANPGVLDLVADKDLYVDGRPLLWLGTDVFLPAAGQAPGQAPAGGGGLSPFAGRIRKARPAPFSLLDQQRRRLDLAGIRRRAGPDHRLSPRFPRFRPAGPRAVHRPLPGQRPGPQAGQGRRTRPGHEDPRGIPRSRPALRLCPCRAPGDGIPQPEPAAEQRKSRGQPRFFRLLEGKGFQGCRAAGVSLS